MRERTAGILEAAIQEFINVGEPVSSTWLYDRYDFGIKPAMIRFELEDLVDRGYLEQLHHSAGRIPSNKGYEFFAERILEGDSSQDSCDKRLRHLFQEEAWEDLLEGFSSRLGLFGIAANEKENIVNKDGLEILIDKLDWGAPEEIKMVVHDFLDIESRIDAADPKLHKEEVQVFVGRKSPLTKSDNLAVVTGEYRVESGNVLLVAIGPKRMDYKKTLAIFKNFYE